ncbi:MAG: helix-turn-helix domain-containing protein [Actinomycetota bacterium]|jgi:transcriptional regulator with XRE-family HTH domain
MDAARVLRQARRRAGLTQRELAARAGVAQSVVGRIETGAVIPRVDTLDRLLAAAGQGLESTPRPGRGVDRTLGRGLLALTPGERARVAARNDRNVMEVSRRARRTGPVRTA